jgi:plasmid stabilization system protein ParE
MKSKKYTLTRGAASDLDEIYQKSIELFGISQTNKFFAELQKAAEFAADHIGKIQTRGMLTGKSGLRLYPVNKHFIAYRPISKKHIVIISVFKQSRDIQALIAAREEEFKKDFAEIDEKLKSGKLVIL